MQALKPSLQKVENLLSRRKNVVQPRKTTPNTFDHSAPVSSNVNVPPTTTSAPSKSRPPIKAARAAVSSPSAPAQTQETSQSAPQAEKAQPSTSTVSAPAASSSLSSLVSSLSRETPKTAHGPKSTTRPSTNTWPTARAASNAPTAPVVKTRNVKRDRFINYEFKESDMFSEASFLSMGFEQKLVDYMRGTLFPYVPPLTLLLLCC